MTFIFPSVSEFVTSKQVSITLQGGGAVPVEGSPKGDRSRELPLAAQKRDQNMSSSEVEGSNNNSKKKRRFLSAEKKFQIYLEAQDSAKPVGELLRREGLYSTDLARIRQSRSRKGLSSVSVPNLDTSRARSTPMPMTPLRTNSRTRNGPWLIWRSNWPSCEKKRMGVRGTDSRSMDQ